MRKDSSKVKRIEGYSYSLNNGIGKGYSSHVYKGQDDNTNEQVAIKVIDVKMLKGEVHKNLLASELQLLRVLKHSQNVIDLYDIYSTKNNTYIITELCDGDLSKTINDSKLLTEAHAVNFMRQIIIGWSSLHQHGVIHRDLKPANIFLKDGEVKLGDFGFAIKVIEGKKYCSYNVGSPIYMPPEALNENKYSFKSDIWALGVIFYEMLTGKTPWKAKTEKELSKLLTTISITKLLPKNISSSSIDFLTRTLEVDYNRRMCPEQLIRFIFSDISDNKYLSRQIDRSTTHPKEFNEALLTRNSVSNAKNPQRFQLMKINQSKNTSLPKTAATIGKTQNHLPTTCHLPTTEKKFISKQLLTQIHFCRFLYKLINRIQNKIMIKVSNTLVQLMWKLIFKKLSETKSLTQLDYKIAREYKCSTDYDKIVKIIQQYQEKYSKGLTISNNDPVTLETVQSQLQVEIMSLYQAIKEKEQQLEVMKQEIITLDYLVTLRQLIIILLNNDLEAFHTKSKMQAIVEGQPSSTITNQHLKAISNKLHTIGLMQSTLL